MERFVTFGQAITDVELSAHKYLRHAERLQALAAGGDVYPVSVELDPVDYCNHRCGWCVDPRHGRTTLDLEMARRLLDELHGLRVEGIVLKGGGEPTLHPGFGALLAVAGEHGFEVGVVTNGSRLENHAPSLAHWAAYVRVSVDGPTPASHRAVHGTEDFGSVVAGVEKLIEQRGPRRHPVIGLSYAMDFAAIGLVDTAVALGDRLGVDYVLFRAPFFEEVGRVPTMTIAQMQSLRQAFVAAQQAHHGRTRVLVDHWIGDSEAADLVAPLPSSPRRGTFAGPGANGVEHLTGRCLASPLMAVIASDGAVYPCCNLRALDEWRLGRIDYERGLTFREIWSGPQRRAVMTRLRRIECIRSCTHPLSKYNEAIEYLGGPQYHGGFV
jgi:radical SAM protein with 4Fe4S-binding SPASM domain